MIIETERLLLRPFAQEDLDDLAALNADPEVMRHFLAPLDRDATMAAIERYETHRAAYGFAMSAAVERATGRLLGIIGLQHIRYPAPFTPAIEVGWRLRRDAWGHGYAIEGARTAVEWGFGPGGISEIVAVTLPDNLRSRSVMDRLGMTRDEADDFEHPLVPVGHRMRRHVVYRLRKPA
jgi:ribosomal-protein-alanine N-acetyltransferase